jgi:hypothetical protein
MEAIMIVGRRQFLSSTMSTLALATASQGLGQRRSTGGSVQVTDFGAAGDGVADDTKAFSRALSRADEVVVPAGIYSVDQIIVPAGKRLTTAGTSTVFRQRPGMRTQTPIVVVAGSNVTIGSFAAEGNIDSDPGEWMHAISVLANDSVGDLSDITIGDVVGTRIRGDVLYLGARPGRMLSRVRAGNVSGDNIYRNIVSIVGTGAQGGDIAISSITGTRVGLFHFDIEPEAVPVAGVTVGSIKGRNISVSGQQAAASVSSVQLGTVDLSPSYGEVAVANPIDARSVRPHAYQQRNASAVSIGDFRAQGFDGQAILFVESALPEMTLQLANCDIQDCSRNDPRNALIMGQQGKSKVRIDQLRIAVPDNKMAMVYCDDCVVGSVAGALGTGSGLIYGCSRADIRSLNLTSANSTLASNCVDAHFAGGSAAISTIAYGCDRLKFEDMTLSGTFKGGSVDQKHELTRTTLNDVYYEHDVIAPLQNA